MNYPPVPKESKREINRAGELLVSDTDYIGGVENARQLLGKWRACHLKPLQAFADDLNERLIRLGIHAIVARRLKRLFRIRDKIRPPSTMNVTQMQDIGALRAVVPTLADVRRLEKDYRDRPPTVGIEIAAARKDYIETPKENGYRSIHLVFRFTDSPPSEYDGIRIELQIRSNLQHDWASAVEVTGLVSGFQIKYDEGDPAWRDFFKIASEAIARSEGAPQAAAFAGWTDADVLSDLRGIEAEVGALDTIRRSGWPFIEQHAIYDTLNASGDDMVLLRLNVTKRDLSATFYWAEEHEKAIADYADAEQKQVFDDENTSVVLVRVSTTELLRRAYPTFFLDISGFANVLEGLLDLPQT